MPFHKGFRLKNKIDKSNFSTTKVAELANIPRTTLYDLYKKADILDTVLQPILAIIGVSVSEFNGIENVVNEPAAMYGQQSVTDALKRENELLKEQVAQLKEMVALLKKKK